MDMFLKNKKKLNIFASFLIIVLLTQLTSCASDNVDKELPTDDPIAIETKTPSPEVKDKTTPTPPVESIITTQDKKENKNEDKDKISPVSPPQIATSPLVDADILLEVGLFAPIIEAYAELEQSGYTSYNEDTIGDSLLAIGKGITYNFGWNVMPILMYTLYDINADGLPELIIGADGSISGIYALQNGKPVSVIQVEDHYYLSLLKDINGNCVIEHAWGRMSISAEYYYTIDKNGKLVTLDILYTNGDDKIGDEFVGHFRAKDVGGEEVSITEEEYCELIGKYGAWGYEPLEDTGEVREVNIEWKSILPIKSNIEDKIERYLDGLFQQPAFSSYIIDNKEPDYLSELLSNALHQTSPVSTSVDDMGYTQEHIKLSDTLETAALLYDKEIVDSFTPSDVFYYNYDSDSQEFVSWGYYDPPVMTVPVILGCSVNNNIYEVIISTSLVYGYLGYYLYPVADDGSEYAGLFNEAVYFDVLSEEEFYSNEENKYINGHYYHFYDDYIQVYGPADQRAREYVKEHPATLKKFEVTLKIDGESIKLKSIELVK